MQGNKKYQVYFVPGMGANEKIFERIRLPKSVFESEVIPWLPPKEKEPLDSYVKRMLESVKHPKPILLGVSFGGVIVQEMSKCIDTEATIIVSSVKSREEFPLYMKFASATGAHKLLTASGILSVKDFSKLGISKSQKKILKQFEAYMTVRDKKYLTWAIDAIVNWDRKKADPNVHHIHGTSDEIFPYKRISNAEAIEGGTHAMIITKGSSIVNKILQIIKPF